MIEKHISYLMESANEAERLRTKDKTGATIRQLLDTGIDSLGTSPYIVDAGAGVGVVAKEIAGLIARTSQNARIILLDSSSERLKKAEELLDTSENITFEFLKCDLEDIPLPSYSIDFLWCRFVFEYLPNPEKAFSEFTRIIKPGGKLVVGDLDYNSLTHYPLPESLASQLQILALTLQRAKLFDFYAGRKLYGYFYNAGYMDIDVHFYAHHLFFGELDPVDEYNWISKIDRLIAQQDEGRLKLDFSLKNFKPHFLDFLRSPSRFSYSPLILVEGRKRL